jgi:hypothetical protein
MGCSQSVLESARAVMILRFNTWKVTRKHRIPNHIITIEPSLERRLQDRERGAIETDGYNNYHQPAVKTLSGATTPRQEIGGEKYAST